MLLHYECCGDGDEATRSRGVYPIDPGYNRT
jgi:hypothetical protein